MITEAEKKHLYNAAKNYRDAIKQGRELWECEAALLRVSQPDVIVRLIEHYDGLVPSEPPAPSEPESTTVDRPSTKGEIRGAF